MPKMTYVPGVGYVRAGSWSTKDIIRKWRIIEKQLQESETMLMRLEYLLFEEESNYSRIIREGDQDRYIWRLEEIRDYANRILNRFPKERRAKALENIAGRTPEEAAIFLAKAKEIRESL